MLVPALAPNFICMAEFMQEILIKVQNERFWHCKKRLGAVGKFMQSEAFVTQLGGSAPACYIGVHRYV